MARKLNCGLGLILLGMLCLAGCGGKNKPAESPTSQPALTADEQKARARKIIAEYIHVPESEITLNNVKWFDLIGNDSATEFFADYALGEQIDADRYVCLFSINSQTPQRLFFEKRYVGEYRSAEMITLGGEEYLLMTQRAGSGGFMSLALYRWNGNGGLETLFETGTGEGDPGFFMGRIICEAGRLYVSSGGVKCELVREKGEFKFIPYSHRPVYPQQGEACHILRIDVGKDDKLTFHLDGKPLELSAPNATERYALKTPIAMKPGELLLLDDNLGTPRGLRLFMTLDMDMTCGIFNILYARKAGLFEFSINDGYGPWYDMKILVTPAGRKFITPNYIVTITHLCTEEGCVSCDNYIYQGVSRKTGKSITLRGGTLYTHSPDGTPSGFQGYSFDNADVSYTIYEASSRLVVLQKVGEEYKTLVDEQGKWVD